MIKVVETNIKKTPLKSRVSHEESRLVPMTGIEPARLFRQWILNPLILRGERLFCTKMYQNLRSCCLRYCGLAIDWIKNINYNPPIITPANRPVKGPIIQVD